MLGYVKNINVNNDFNYSLIRNSILSGLIDVNYSLNIKPLEVTDFKGILPNQFKTILKNKKESIVIKSLGLDYFVEFNSHHPYNRNNGTMIPNRGYQHIISPGVFFKIGPLSIQLKPEHHYSDNKAFDGFWEGHYPEIWAKRYQLWNHIDMPERLGTSTHNKTTIGQSNIKLNWKNISLGISNAIMAESSLAFLGLGVQAPIPTWGGMINDGKNFLRIAHHLSTIPGLFICITVLAFNLVGESLRDYLDVKIK